MKKNKFYFIRHLFIYKLVLLIILFLSLHKINGQNQNLKNHFSIQIIYDRYYFCKEFSTIDLENLQPKTFSLRYPNDTTIRNNKGVEYFFIGAGFKNDTIIIYQNDSLIYKSIVSTENDVGIADTFEYTQNDSLNHQFIKVQLNSGIQAKFTMDNNLKFISIEYDPFINILIIISTNEIPRFQ
jgi:hypothetical protein